MPDDVPIDENSIYDEFPRGDSDGNGPDEGFNTWIRINDKSLFRSEALDENPALRAFVEAPFAVTYGQFKSSHRESEYWVHKPKESMTGEIEGILGFVEGFPGGDAVLTTMVMNHERTLARHVTRPMIIADGRSVGQLVHKESESEDSL